MCSLSVQAPPLPPCIAICETISARSWNWLDNLPQGCGILIRYGNAMEPAQIEPFARAARQAGHMVLLGRNWRAARTLRLGYHMASSQLGQRIASWPNQIVSAAVHNRRDLHAAEKAGADFALISPVFPTATHPKVRPLGIMRLMQLAQATRLPIYALGGMTPQRWQQLPRQAFPQIVGYAARGYFLAESSLA